MFIAAAILAVLLSAALVVSAVGKLTKRDDVVTIMNSVGVPTDQLWLLAVIELLGAAGMIIGLFWWPLGVVAAAGVVAYFLGAVGAHLRVGDRKGMGPAGFLLVIAIVTLLLRVLSV